MEFLWECMILSLKVGLGSICWSLVITIPIIILGIIITWFDN